MIKNDYFAIDNIIMDKPKYEINEFISLSTLENNRVLVSVKKTGQESGLDDYESNVYLFYHSLQLGLPKLNLRISKPPEGFDPSHYESLKSWNTPLFKFTSAINDDIEKDSSEAYVTKVEIDQIKKFHKIYCEHSKTSRESRLASRWKESRWSYALNQYTSACINTTIENSNQTLITGLEALLVKSDGNLQYKVSLNASLILGESFEQRSRIIEQVKKMYNLRSKAAHGEITELRRLLNKPSVYDDYFELKSILSRLLFLTYGKTEEEIFERLNYVLLSGPSF